MNRIVWIALLFSLITPSFANQTFVKGGYLFRAGDYPKLRGLGLGVIQTFEEHLGAIHQKTLRKLYFTVVAGIALFTEEEKVMDDKTIEQTPSGDSSVNPRELAPSSSEGLGQGKDQTPPPTPDTEKAPPKEENLDRESFRSSSYLTINPHELMVLLGEEIKKHEKANDAYFERQKEDIERKNIKASKHQRANGFFTSFATTLLGGLTFLVSQAISSANASKPLGVGVWVTILAFVAVISTFLTLAIIARKEADGITIAEANPQSKPDSFDTIGTVTRIAAEHPMLVRMQLVLNNESDHAK